MPPKARTSQLTYAGACRMGLELDCDTKSCGDVFTGRVLFRGGRNSQRFERAAVHLGGQDFELNSIVYESVRWDGLVVLSGETKQLDFSLRVPDRTYLQYRQLVWVAARAEHDIEVSSGTNVQILPQVCFLQLSQLLAEVARIPVATWTTTSGGDGVAAKYIPEGPARNIFDGLRLEMFRSASGQYGELEIDPCQHTLADHLKALTGADRRRFPFRFKSSSCDEARSFFEECLRPYPDAVRQLPIPSIAAPQNTSGLPRPSDRALGKPE